MPKVLTKAPGAIVRFFVENLTIAPGAFVRTFGMPGRMRRTRTKKGEP